MCRMYFKEFVMYPHVVSISMLPYPCNIGSNIWLMPLSYS